MTTVATRPGIAVEHDPADIVRELARMSLHHGDAVESLPHAVAEHALGCPEAELHAEDTIVESRWRLSVVCTHTSYVDLCAAREIDEAIRRLDERALLAAGLDRWQR